MRYKIDILMMILTYLMFFINDYVIIFCSLAQIHMNILDYEDI